MLRLLIGWLFRGLQERRPLGGLRSRGGGARGCRRRWKLLRVGVFGGGLVSRVVIGRRASGLCHVRLTYRALGAFMSTMLQTSRSTSTYQLLLVDEPLVNLRDMEQMIAWQHAHAIALHKHLQADRTLHLFFNPGGQR